MRDWATDVRFLGVRFWRIHPFGTTDAAGEAIADHAIGLKPTASKLADKSQSRFAGLGNRCALLRRP
ncbi:MAG TPA: hypothetical protein VI958_00960, partial [Acidobacteriota bacterium]